MDTSLFELHSLVTEIERRAESHGLSVQFSDDVAEPAIDGNTIVFPTLRQPISQEDLNYLKYLSIHVPLHLSRKGYAKAIAKDTSKEKNLTAIFNMVEDSIIEHQHSDKYFGDRLDMDNGHKVYYNKLIKILENQGGNYSALSKEDHINLAAVLANIYSRATWSPGLLDTLKELTSVSSPESRALLKKLDEAGLLDKLTTVGDVDYSFNLAKEIYEVLYDSPPPDEQESPQPNESGESEDNKEDGDEEPGDGTDEGESDECGTNTTDSEEGKEVKAKSPPLIDWNGFKKQHHIESGSYNIGVNYGGKHEYAHWQPALKSETIEIDLKNGIDVVPGEEQHSSCFNTKNLDKEDNSDRLLSNQVRRLLLVETRSEFLKERSSGKLATNNLYRVAIPQVGDGSWNSRVFKQRHDYRRVDTCVTVLVDWSGSMSNANKMQTAALSSYRLYDVFGKTLRIPFELLSFTSGTHLYHGIVKSYAEKLITKEQVYSRFKLFSRVTNGNADADAILWAASRIMRRPEKRKIIIVLSDGSPTDCGSASTDADGGLIKVINELNTKSPIEVYGIGIMMHNVDRYYGKKCRNIIYPSELNQALIDTLHDMIIKKH
jgi:cobalamin biosynthesis protein CobT